MNKFTLSLLAGITLLLSLTAFSQQDITIGSGSYSNYYNPFRNYYGYSWSANIYTKSEIGSGYNINELSYNIYSTYSSAIPNQKIYMAEISDSSFNSNTYYIDPSSVNATLVYDGSITYNTTGWKTLTLQSSFYYSGSGHLLILYESRRGSSTYSYYPRFYSSYFNYGTKSKYLSSSSSNIFTTSNYGSSYNYRPDIKLGVSPASSNDLALTDWVYPTSSSSVSSSTPVIIKVKNLGSAAQSGFDLKYSIDNGQNWVTETYNNTLASGSETSYSFSTSANMGSSGLYQMKAVVSNTGDTINYNDTISQELVLCSGAMSGTYTIGSSSSADYSNINAALTMLKTCGISGPVTFNIESGTYNEQIRIPSFTGLSSTNTVTFKSNTGNANDVVIKYSANSTKNYTLALDTTSNIIIKDLSIKSLDNFYSGVVKLKNSSYNKIENCIISSPVVTNTTNNKVITVEGNTTNSSMDNVFENNKINKGAYSFYIQGGGASSYIKNHIIKGNEISGFSNQAIYSTYVDSLIVQQNEIESSELITYGIQIYNSTNSIEVKQNKLNVIGDGIYLYNANGSSSEPVKVQNNFVYLNNTSSGDPGIATASSSFVDIDFNTVHIIGTNSYTRTIDVSSGAYINIRNNNLINKSPGYGIYVANANSILSSDYNNIYTIGSYLAYWGTYYYTLSSLQSSTSKNQNSISSNVNFYSNSNLHTNSSVVNGQGTPITGVTVDIDGETRNSTSPDIGADEFSIYQSDGGLVEFVNIANVCPSTTVDVKVNLKNFGSANITSASIDWEINGVSQTTKNWSGILSSGSNTNITLGSTTLNNGTTYEFKAYISSINSVTDSNAVNDTTMISGIETSMGAGTYQIGSSSSADFNTISDAINAMTQNGICGPIVFNIESGTFNNQYAFQSIQGASATNTITFKSLSGNANDVVFKYESQTSTSNAYVIHLDGAEYYRFKDISFKSESGGSYNRVAYLSNYTKNVEFDNCNFFGSISTTSSYSSPIHSEYTDSLTIKNSEIKGGYYGVYVYGYSSDYADEILISNNDISDFSYSGTYVYYGNNVEISNNTYTERTNANSPRVIYLRYGPGNKIVNANLFQQQSSAGYYGIFIEDENTGSYISNLSEVTNNIINMNKSSSSGTYGIYIDNSDRINIYFNTVFSNSTYTYSSAVYLYYPYYINLKNNSLHVGTGYPVYSYNAYYLSTDYNNLKGDNYIGRENSSTYYTLSSWQYAVSGDYNSQSVTPNYVSSSDLHMYDYNLDGAGTSVGITTDIDGDSRSTSSPDIGADEFDILARDIEVSEISSPNDTTGIGSRDVKVKIKNWGSTNLTTATLNWSVDGTNQTSHSWSGNLANLAESTEINIGTYNFTSGDHIIKVWSSNPNGSSDLNNDNDTLTKSVHAKLIPVIEVIPNSITETITNCDDSITVPVYIKNSGGANLTYNVQGVAQAYDSTISQTFTTTGQNMYYTFTGLSSSIDTLEVTVTINGDYNSSSEYATIYIDNVSYGNMGTANYTDITSTFTITGSTLASFLADGQIYVIVDNSSQVNTGYGTNENKVQVTASGANWIDLSGTMAGTIIPGDSNLVNVKLNSLGLQNGTYNYSIDISGNDPGNPAITVPVTMIVDGSPIIVTSANSINIGSTYVGNTLSDSIMISNTGCDTLFLTNAVSSNSSVFSATILDPYILPNQSTYLVVDFSPAAVTSYSETITLHNNDANQVINVSGNGITPPTLTVTPDPINVTIQHCNDTAQVNLKLENTGSGVLNVNMPAPTDSVKVLMLTYGGSSSSNTNLSNAFQYYSNVNVDVEEYYSASSSSIQTKVNSYEPDIIAIPYIGSTYSSYFSSISTTLQNFANSGGYVVFAGQYYSANMQNTGLFSGSYSGYEDAVNVTNQTPNDSLCIGLSSSFYVGYSDDFYYWNFSNTNVTTHVSYSSYDLFASRPFGSGKAIYIGFHYYYSSSATQPKIMAANIAREKSHEKVSYMDYTSANYNINASNQVFKTITFDATGLSTGTYYNTIRFNTNNPSNPLVEVPCTLNVLNQMANPISLGNDTTHCGSLNLDAGSGYSSYLWNNNSTSQVITAGSTGYYSVTVSDGNGCTSSDTILVTVNPLPTVVMNSVPSQMCEYDAAINLGGSPNGGVFTGTGVSANTFDPAVAGTGTHTITYTYTNSYNCTNYDNETITVNAKPTASFSGLDANYCPEESGDILTGSPSGGTFTGNGINGNTFNAISAGPGNHTISYIYTNAGGCSDTATQSTTVYSPVSITIGGYSANYCESDSSDTLFATPAGGTFNGNGMMNNVFVPMLAGAGTHYITYEYNNNGCINTDSIQITVNSNPNVNLSGISGNVCSNAGIQNLNTSPAGGVLTGNGITGTSFDPSIAGIGHQLISYAYTNTYGCTSYDTLSFDVVSPATISFNGLSQNYCFNSDTVQLAAIPAGGVFSGNGVVGNSFIPQNAGTGSHYIKYSVTDVNSCISIDSQLVNVIAPTAVTFSGLNTNYCNNGTSSSLTGNPAGGLFSGPGINLNTFNPVNANVGTNDIIYTYTDQYGCISTDTQSTNVVQAPIVNAGQDTTIDSGTQASLNAQVTGGSASMSYQWTPFTLVANANALSTQTTNLTSTTNFILNVTDNTYGCQGSDQVSVFVQGGPLSVNIVGSPAVICEGDSAQLTATPTGGSGTYTYSWTSNPPGFTSTLQNPKVAPTSTRTYTCVVNDGTNNANSSIVVSVNQVPNIILELSDSVFCSNEPDELLTLSPMGGVLSGSGISGTSFSPSSASIGLSNITYTYTTSQGCVTSKTVQVRVNEAPTAFAGNDTAMSCANSGVQLGQQPYPNTIYVWSPAYNLSNPFASNPYLTPNMSMNYTLTAIDTTNMCSETDDVQITITDAPVVQVSNDTIVCLGDTAHLSASGGIDYLWNTGDTSSAIHVSPDKDSVYTVIATVGQCADFDSVLVMINNPKPNLISDTTICHNESILLDAGSIWYSYQWNTGDLSQVISVDSAGYGLGTHEFIVTVEDALGCFGSDTVMITIDDCTGLEGDFNDGFLIKVYPNPTNSQLFINMEGVAAGDMKMNIYNSSGKLVKSETVTTNGNELKYQIDMSTYAKGLYILQMGNEKFRKSVKIVLQ